MITTEVLDILVVVYLGNMMFNVCETCGACDGRCGMLIQQLPNGPNECLNCKDTRERQEVVIHLDLERTSEEIARTMEILDEHWENEAKEGRYSRQSIVGKSHAQQSQERYRL